MLFQGWTEPELAEPALDERKLSHGVRSRDERPEASPSRPSNKSNRITRSVSNALDRELRLATAAPSSRLNRPPRRKRVVGRLAIGSSFPSHSGALR